MGYNCYVYIVYNRIKCINEFAVFVTNNNKMNVFHCCVMFTKNVKS